MEERYIQLQQLAEDLTLHIQRYERQQGQLFEDNAVYDVHYIMNKMIKLYQDEFQDFYEET